VVEGVLVGYCKSLSQYLVLGRDGKTYVVTNPIFLKDEPSFLAKEKVDDFGDEPAFKYAYENSMPEMPVQDESTVEKGAEKGVGRDVEGEVDREVVGEGERDVGEARSHDLVEPIAAPASASTRKSPRDRRPTRAAIESKQTEQIYGHKPRQVRRREERERSESIDQASRAVKCE
jgi:hypothetical protein